MRNFTMEDLKVIMACLITIAVIIAPLIISAHLNDKEDKCNKEISKKDDDKKKN